MNYAVLIKLVLSRKPPVSHGICRMYQLYRFVVTRYDMAGWIIIAPSVTMTYQNYTTIDCSMHHLC